MTTAVWIVIAIAVLELGGFGFLWILWLVHEHAGVRQEPSPEHPGAPTISRPTA